MRPSGRNYFLRHNLVAKPHGRDPSAPPPLPHGAAPLTCRRGLHGGRGTGTFAPPGRVGAGPLASSLLRAFNYYYFNEGGGGGFARRRRRLMANLPRPTRRLLLGDVAQGGRGRGRGQRLLRCACAPAPPPSTAPPLPPPREVSGGSGGSVRHSRCRAQRGGVTRPVQRRPAVNPGC